MSAAEPTADRPVSLAEHAYRLLEEKLVTLELPPGSMISEGKLIELSGLGRTPVREALQRLAQQGFFLVMPRKGLQVTPLSRASMEALLETRKPPDNLIVTSMCLIYYTTKTPRYHVKTAGIFIV